MKKLIVLAVSALMITGVTMADTGKKKKGAKGKTCSSKTGKSCTKDKTAKL